MKGKSQRHVNVKLERCNANVLVVLSTKNEGHSQPLSRTPLKKDIFIIASVKPLSNFRGPFCIFIFVRKILRIGSVDRHLYSQYNINILRFECVPVRGSGLMHKVGVIPTGVAPLFCLSALCGENGINPIGNYRIDRLSSFKSEGRSFLFYE